MRSAGLAQLVKIDGAEARQKVQRLRPEIIGISIGQAMKTAVVIHERRFSIDAAVEISVGMPMSARFF